MEGQLDFLNLDEELDVAIPEDSKVRDRLKGCQLPYLDTALVCEEAKCSCTRAALVPV